MSDSESTMIDDELAEGTRVTNEGTEAWKTLPADSEAAVDYPTEEKECTTLSPSVDLTTHVGSELSVDLTIYTPDGMRLSISETWDVQGSSDGCAEDVQELLDVVFKTAQARFA